MASPNTAGAPHDGDIPVVTAEDKDALVAAGITEDALARPFRVVIPKGVTEIAPRAFVECEELTSVTIPDGVTAIGDYAFCRCSGLTSVALPEGVTSIGDGAFKRCSGLTFVAIPEGVTSISDSAFYGCSGLTSVAIPEGVTSIGNRAFYGCSRLTSVTIPESVTKIDHGAFRDCIKLAYVTIPRSVTTIGSQAFQGCSGLTSITIPDKVVEIGGGAFAGCEWLVVAFLPTSLQTLHTPWFRQPGVFEDCSRLSFAIVPPHVRIDRDIHFSNCPLLAPLQEETPRSRLQALRLQCWSVATHRLCSERRREWVVTVMLVAGRLRSLRVKFPLLPIEMWLAILEYVPRWELGPHH